MSYRLLKLKKPKLFKPKFSRGDPTLVYADAPNNLSFKGVIGNSASTGSFRYSQNRTLKSTQTLNVNYAYFENHTFFDSALSKTNIVFDKMINQYPFDGTLKEVEDFEDNLSGFEMWVLDNYPKSTGNIHFSGSAVGEDPANSYPSEMGQFIKVKDGSGLEFPIFSRDKSARPVLDPGLDPVSFEFFIKIPDQANDNQIIFQKRESLSRNITLALEKSTSTTSAGIKFGITSGSDYLFVSSSLSKGSFQHLSAQLDRSAAQHKLNFYLNGQFLTASSEQFELGNLTFSNSDFLIGTGSEVRINETVFTPKQTLSGAIDEFRYFKSVRPASMIRQDMFLNVYSTNDLALYYRFNETSETHNLNNVVLDSSGNSLHAKVNRYASDCRTRVLDNPLTSEVDKRSPVLFYVDSVDKQYQELINSASFYDEFNPNLITKLFPAHYFLEGDDFEGYDFNNPLSNLETKPVQSGLPGSAKFGTTQLLISFLLIWAKFFDQLKLFVDSFGDLRNIDYETEDTIADEFLHSLADYYNIDLPDLFPNANLNQLVEGIDVYSDFSKRSTYTLAYIQNQIWRRLLVNAVHINRSNGTIEGLRSVLRTIGINVDDIFTIREYGGYTQQTLDGIRINKTDNLRLLSFTGSIAEVSSTLSAQGIPDNKPYLQGSYLSGSRVEVGLPLIKGTFVNKRQFPPHGISNNKNDGLLTSGSFTYEGVYKFPSLLTGSYPQYQSLARIHITGSQNSALTHGVITNLVLVSGSVPELRLYTRPGRDSGIANSPLLSIHVYSASMFDGDMWNVSFGRRRGDLVDLLQNEEKSISSSYFLRVGKIGDRRLNQIYSTSSYFKEHTDSSSTAYDRNVFQDRDSNQNSSGSFVVIGSQSIETAGASSRYLNNSGIESAARTTNFAGEAGLIRFWSKEINENSWKEHVRNPTSVGVKDPTKNYNFLLHNTGTFEQMRVQTISKQGTTASDGSGNIRLFDFSQNNLHFSGTGYEPNIIAFKADQLRYSTLNPQFDVLGTTEKVRVRSLQNIDKITGGGYPYARTAPIYNLQENEEVFDDLRFSLEMSLVKALNEDIVNMFSDYQFIENALGRTNLLFAEKYPQLDQVRKNYFENTTGKLDVEKYYKLFKWFNDTFTDTIERMLPSKTKFMGVNFVIESHALERHKLKYYYDQIYLTALQRNPARGLILLSQFVGTLKKF